MNEKQLVVECAGGLDLQTPPISAPNGTLRDCLNFEVSTKGGYSQCSGWTIHDGGILGPDVPRFCYLTFRIANWNGISFTYGEQVALTVQFSGTILTQQININCIGFIAGSPTTDCVLLMAFTPTSGGDVVYLNGASPIDALGAVSGGQYSSISGQYFLQEAGDGLPDVTTYQTWRSVIEQQQRVSVRRPPGQKQDSLDGVFFYKDRNYVIHNCTTWYFNSGSNGVIQEGNKLGPLFGAYGTVLSVVVESGDWNAGTAAGYVIVYDELIVPGNGIPIDLISADGLTNLGNVFTSGGPGFLSDLRPLDRALLYSAEEQKIGDSFAIGGFAPWVRHRLCRELGYKQTFGTSGIGFGPQNDNDYSIYEYTRLGLNQQLDQVQSVTTAYKFPNTATQSAAYWLNINNIKAEDGAVATCIGGATGNTTWIKGTQFDFTEIPIGSVITGLEVVIRRRANTAANTTKDWSVRLQMPDMTLVGEHANSTVLYPVVLTDAVYGGTNDTWSTQLTREVLNDPNFGVYFEARRLIADSVSVDDIKIRVTYVPATRRVYIRNSTSGAPTDIAADVVHYTVDSGSPTTHDQQGVLTLVIGTEEWQGTAAGKSRRIGPNEQIRTAPGGGGALLGWTTNEDVPTSFPAGASLDAVDSRWEFVLANFYADPDAEMVFAANGVEYACMWDGTYLVRIRTGRRSDLDNPRHIAAHLGYMHFGFPSGDIITSADFRPLTVDPALGSQLRNVGEPIVGMGTINGQTLGVLTDRAHRGYQGTSPANYAPIVITPAVGSIEYTYTTLAGTPMWTSSRGVESLSTVSAYGDFATLPLTYFVTPWLQDRVQFDARTGIVDKRPAMALAVRSKRQYRLYFRDGYYLTVSIFGIESKPMCTIGRLENDRTLASANGVYIPYTNVAIRSAFAGVRSDGKEVLIAAFERQNPKANFLAQTDNFDGGWPYLVRLDSGRTFCGSAMTAFFELNPIYPGFPIQDQKIDNVQGWADIQPSTVLNWQSETIEDKPITPNTPIQSLTLQPDEFETFIPFPNYSFRIDAGRAGYFMRVRFNVDTNAVYEPVRVTHLVMTYSSNNVKRI